MNDKPILIAENNPPKEEVYAMECTLTIGNDSRWCKFEGFASLDVVRAFMDIMREVVDE